MIFPSAFAAGAIGTGDDKDAKASVTHLLDQFGFDTVDAGPLREGWRIQRDTPGYGPRRTAEELRRDLAAAKRYRVG
jgi:predicted dinucleotide-binding enzyme